MPNHSPPDYGLIDAHCHLDFEVFDKDRAQVLQRAREQNIRHMIIPGTQADYWPRISRLCKQYANLHACYGLHPYWSARHNEHDLDTLARFIRTNPAVAIGECGLDFRTQQAPQKQDREQQLLFFEAQLALARERKLPVVIHAVRATETVIQCLKKFKGVHGMIHSYSGSLEQAEQLIDLGFYISLSASITYKSAKKIRRVAKRIPLQHLLLETDAPDQTDEKHRGRRNEPAFLNNTLNALASLRAESEEHIARQTTENARKLFGLKN